MLKRPLVPVSMLVVICSMLSFCISDKKAKDKYLMADDVPGAEYVIYEDKTAGLMIKEGECLTMGGRICSMTVGRHDGYSVYGKDDDTESDTEYLDVCLRGMCIYKEQDNGACYDQETCVSVGLPWQQVKVRFYTKEDLHMGEYIVIRGRVKDFEKASNPGQFDSYSYYHSRGMLFSVNDAVLQANDRMLSPYRQKLYEIRLSGEEVLTRYLDPDDAAIIKAMLFGNKSELGSDIRELFRKNGIAHILAISGLHISFLAMLLYRILGLFMVPTKLKALISEAAIVTYGFMVGFTPSAFRAIFMFSLFLLSKAILRTYDMLTALSAALIPIALLYPGMLFDTGVMLSFLAVAGVGFFYASFVKNIYDPGRRLSAVGVSFFVFMTTLPVVLDAYYEAAFYSIILNIIIIPLMSVLLVASIILVLFGNWFRPSAAIFIIKGILWMYKGVCRTMSNYKLLTSNIGAPKIWQVILFYILLVSAVTYRGRYKKAACGLMLVSSLLIMHIHPFKGLNICMLDIGQGDCMVLTASDGIFLPSHTYIIDCGSSSKKAVGERRLIPLLKYYGIDRVEAVFITHPDSDHINGIEELLAKAYDENVKIGRICVFSGFIGDGALKNIEKMTDMSECGDLYRADETAMTEQVNNGTAMRSSPPLMTPLSEGMMIKDGRLKFHVIYPGKGHDITDPNEASLVMHVEYGDFDMLTTGDAGKIAEEYIVERFKTPQIRGTGEIDGRDDMDVDVLKVGHHGSSTSTGDKLLSLTDPEVAIISCGLANSYGHPHKETLKRLNEHDVNIYRTDRSGAVILHTDGKKYSVSTFFCR